MVTKRKQKQLNTKNYNSFEIQAEENFLEVKMEDEMDTNSLGEIKDEPTNERLLDENQKLKRLVSKLESEKVTLKSKLKEMGEETAILQKRLQEISVESDKDSSDPLSELEKQEELLKNISTKNKHIKRLIRDIESLQLQNIEQSKTIIDMEKKSQLLKAEVQELRTEQISSELEKQDLTKSVNDLTSEIARLEGNITYLEDERDKADLELKDFIEKLEERAIAWRNIIIEKENQLESLRKKYDLLTRENPERIIDSEHDNQFEKLVEAVQERDQVIEELENKLKSMTDEMIASTQLMNRISTEREADKVLSTKQDRSCCKIVQDSLNISQKRCKELLEMLDKLEEDNLIISKQKLEATNALEAYKKGEDGLSNLLYKIGKLEQKVNSRDKQIKALVMEINSLHEISQENTVLRKKLNIPDDLVVSTTNLVAKQRNKDKLIERLKLKLRASEEIRLQLKLDKNDLMKDVIDLRHQLSTSHTTGSSHQEENLLKGGSFDEPLRQEIYCDNCLKNIQVMPNQNDLLQDVIKEWEQKYSGVIEENENLRVGMHEILEKIREYDVCSDHITIDCTILEKVLHALDARSISGWYHPAMRIQNELIAVKEREQALKEKMHMVKSVSGGSTTITPEKLKNHSIPKMGTSKSVSSLVDESVDDDNSKIKSPIKLSPQNSQILVENTTTSYPMIVEKDFEDDNLKKNLNILMQKNRELEVENETLKIYQSQYTELLKKCEGSENELTNYCSSIVGQLSSLEINFKNANMKYDFLKEDFDNCLTEHKISEIKNSTLIADLKKEVNNKRHEISILELSEKKALNNCEPDELVAIKKKYYKLESQMANIISNVFDGKLPGLELMDSFSNFGIIKENMQLDFVTDEEYENIKQVNQRLQNEFEELKLKTRHLKESLSIAHEQIFTQQKLIMEITDNHIDLRHLVADLQTRSEDKFLITKSNRELKLAKEEISKLKADVENVENKEEKLKKQLNEAEQEISNLKAMPAIELKNNELKIRFLKSYVFKLQEKYCKYTPLINLVDIVSSYSKKLKNSTNNDEKYAKNLDEIINTKLDAVKKPSPDSQDLIKLVKYEIKCKVLEEQLISCQLNLESTRKDLEELRIASIHDYEQWKSIQALFGEKKEETVENVSKIVQTEIEIQDNSTNTVPIDETTWTIETPLLEAASPITKSKDIIPQAIDLKTLDVDANKIEAVSVDYSVEMKSLENQLKQAMNLASQRSVLLLETENKLAEAIGRIKEMEKTIISQNELLRNENQNNGSKNASIIETTISSLQSLITEKDTTLRHYQDLLKTEREQHLKSCETYDKELDSIKKVYQDLENTVESRNNEISELKMKIDNVIVVSRRSSMLEKNEQNLEEEFDGNCDNSLNEISDEKIEEMFMDESKNLISNSPDRLAIVVVDECPIRENHELQIQMREARNRLTFWEKSMRAKDEEISFLKEKLSLLQDRERIEGSGNAEIEQLRILLEDKDKHLNDLMDTLSSFHDDQQRFLSETSLYSADQMTQLGTNLTRSETTNKILQTQIEALKRQLNSLSQREKQARELSNTLKSQLIKRPVVSIQTELNTRSKNEQQQKRIGHLEAELEEAKKEVLRQRSIIEAKRAKNASEISLWEKQKRAQQNADKFKLKFEETDKQLEKTRSLLNAARNTITRLEKDKNNIEQKSKGGLGGNCCKTPSCPNLFMPKYMPESPDRRPDCISTKLAIDNNTEIVNKLKYRIEAQQRRINAYEMAGSCSSTRATEFEKLHETLSALEAQNIRWEAKTLQLQLENDMLRQGDENERSKKRIKYLEEYILALKEELAKTEAQHEIGTNSSGDKQSPVSGKVEQTILALKRIVERLKIENKNLKEGSHYNQDRKSRDSTSELSRLRASYKESLEKISALQIELTLKNNCDCTREFGGGDCMNEFQSIKEQLIKKTQLLEKAKILLTRAAAKEKSLKDQLIMWKRKCSELQNVPVIDEISE